MRLWRLSCDTTAQVADTLSQVLEDHVLAVSFYEVSEEKNHWIVEATLKTTDEESPDKAFYQNLVTQSTAPGTIAPQLTLEPLPETDWLEQTWKNFPPRHIGQFYVYGSHTKAAPPAGLIGLEINAATAFGSGEHATTTGCLMTLDELKESGLTIQRPLDMGCGSGILAMAAAKLWNIPVLAVDNDPESVRVTLENAKVNHCDHLIEGLCNEGFDGAAIKERGPFDLIVANILANPLCLMAGDMATNLAPNGRIILSGLLTRQRDEVLAAYTAVGIEFVAQRVIGDWATLELRKP